MNRLKAAAVLTFFLLITFPLTAQDAGSMDGEEPETSASFFLIPILETVFSGRINWRPNWPAEIPPDGFYLSKESKQPAIIELFNETLDFSVKRDSESRLIEFPQFFENGYANVQTSYAASGALQDMSVSLKDFASGAEEGGAQSKEEIYKIEFPGGFLPYSDLSAGGSFPPIKITSGEEVYFVFIFESPAFLTETWYLAPKPDAEASHQYDGESKMLVFCKAIVDHWDGAWRVRSLQIHDDSGLRFEDYHFDAHGNITEIRTADKVFQALYRDSRPTYWRNDFQYELQWDTQGFLTVVKASGEPEDLDTEYRYEYERDTSGNWLKRQEIALKSKFDLLAPRPSFSRGTWNRHIGD